MRKRMTAAALCLFCVLGLLLMPGRMQVMADEVDYFTGEVSLLKEMENSYVFRIDVGNNGEDFEGLVRLRFTGVSSESGCSYEQELTLPSGGQKQYKLTVPASNIEQTKGSGSLLFVNQKGTVLQKISFKDVLGGKTSGIQVGILSDDYDSLTYMDMGGETYGMGNTEKPIRLVKLDKDQVTDALDGLYYLVIDHFDTSVLKAETMEVLEKWVENGGCLMVGTGSYVEQTLSGFDPDFLGVKAGEVSAAGEENQVPVMGSSQNYPCFQEAGIDSSQMPAANLMLTGTEGYETPGFPAILIPKGQGCAAVFSISLGEQEMQKAKQNTEVARVFYDGVTSNAVSASVSTDSDWAYWGQNAFGKIDHENTNVNFTFPKILMLFYVILVGPVLYLILRVVKKRELYWIFVPASAVVFVGVLFLYGQSVKINRTSLYSVTVQEASGEKDADMQTYFSGYHSGVKPWSVKLNDNYTYGGAGLIGYDSGGSSDEDHYVVHYGDGIRIGMNPTSNFETGFLYAAGNGAGHGGIKTEHLQMDGQAFSGTIENQTDVDMPYVAVRAEDYAIVIKDVKKGETIDLAKIHKSSRVVYETNYPEDIFYDMVQQDIGGSKDKNLDLIAALSIGVNVANGHRNQGHALVCGVVPDYEKAASDKCREISYGCLYTIAEQEGNHASN